jgi:hypothetical protein
LLKNLFISFGCILFSAAAFAQFSIATDFAYLRNMKKEQRYGSVGQTIYSHFHASSKDGLYGWISYFTKGKFSNPLRADAKSAITLPQLINFKNAAELRIKQYSVGWKHYLAGNAFEEKKMNVYSLAGFGLIAGRIQNSYNTTIDTSLYNVPPNPVSGAGKFKRLTFDMGLGWEIPIGANIYFYNEARCLFPATSYPSKYLLVNKNAPLTLTVNAGLRVLFGAD